MESESLSFVIAAYALTWVCLIAYTLFAHGTLRRARAEHAQATRRAATGPS